MLYSLSSFYDFVQFYSLARVGGTLVRRAALLVFVNKLPPSHFSERTRPRARLIVRGRIYTYMYWKGA